MTVSSYLRRNWESFSYWGLVVATLFFAFSLTPSLLPRHFASQGLLSGFALAVGYGVGIAGVWVWSYLELPKPSVEVEVISKRVTTICVAAVVASFLWRAAVWQNSIRELMGMSPLTTAYPWRVGSIACVTAALLIGIARGLRICWWSVHRQVNRVVPRRVSYLLSATVVVALAFFAVTHLLAGLLLDVADAVFLQIDKFVDEDVAQPTDSLATGSAESLVGWDSIGLQGKHFIANGPSAAQIGEFFGENARRPLRVYAGLRSAETPEQRAALALAELIRVGGFARSTLIVATPTGTGWLDPGAVDTVEYIHRGDTAIVSMQYSYLPSWITILVDPHRSQDAARALFDKVYEYWKRLPPQSRPKLYLHGLSLGALGSESCADLFTVFDDPIQGGVWSGAPFPSGVWRRITKARNTDSPMWLPTFRDGAMVRFTGRESSLANAKASWSRMRFVYIQHPSDPMVFFSPDLAYRKPEWLVGERGPDVSPDLRWRPIVTFLQTAFDLPMATTVPHGYGHNYAASSYIDAWVEVTEPKDWTEDNTRRLKHQFAESSR